MMIMMMMISITIMNKSQRPPRALILLLFMLTILLYSSSPLLFIAARQGIVYASHPVAYMLVHISDPPFNPTMFGLRIHRFRSKLLSSAY